MFFMLSIALGICLGIIGCFVAEFLEFRRREKFRTQIINNRIQSIINTKESIPVIDTITPRQYAINQLSRRKLVWDEASGTYIIRNQIN